MDADQRPMTSDGTIEGELQALLAVAPSAEFVARVRTRIADDPVRRAWWFPRALVVAAAAAVVIAAIVVRRQVSEAPATERSAEAVALLNTRPLPPIQPFLPLRPVLPHQPAPPVPASQPRGEPEILIDAREASALRSLIRRAGDARIDLQSVIASTSPRVMDLAPLEDVSIEPIVIVPLEEGARQ